MHKITEHREFPGSPVLRTPCFHCTECWFGLLFGELRSCMLCGEAPKKVCARIYIYIYIYIFTYVAVPSLSLRHEGSFSSAMWDPVPRQGIEPWFPALGVRSLSHWTTRESLYAFYCHYKMVILNNVRGNTLSPPPPWHPTDSI